MGSLDASQKPQGSVRKPLKDVVIRVHVGHPRLPTTVHPSATQSERRYWRPAGQPAEPVVRRELRWRLSSGCLAPLFKILVGFRECQSGRPFFHREIWPRRRESSFPECRFLALQFVARGKRSVGCAIELLGCQAWSSNGCGFCSLTISKEEVPVRAIAICFALVLITIAGRSATAGANARPGNENVCLFRGHQALIAKAKAEHKPGQPTVLENILALAPYNVTPRVPHGGRPVCRSQARSGTLLRARGLGDPRDRRQARQRKARPTRKTSAARPSKAARREPWRKATSSSSPRTRRTGTARSTER